MNKRVVFFLAFLLSALPAFAQQPIRQLPTDVDDGSIATGQTATVGLNLGMALDNGGIWRRVTFGTAGTPSTQVTTIQGIGGGTAVPVSQSGTWTLQPGNTANTTPWLFTISQGGNSATVNSSGQISVNCAAGCIGGVSEDALHSSGDAGTQMLTVRSATTPVDRSAGATNGDYEPLQVDANGRLYTNSTFYSSSGAEIIADTQGTHNVAITPASTTGNFGMCRTAATPPTAAGADDRASLFTCDRNGIIQASFVPTANTGYAASSCVVQSAASTNATNCKNAAGNIYGIQAINTTATIYYLRLYNLSSSPTCSSSTGFIRTLPVPASTTGAGFMANETVGEAFGTGIGFCITGGGSSTDNTNAATGVYVTILYK